MHRRANVSKHFEPTLPLHILESSCPHLHHQGGAGASPPAAPHLTVGEMLSFRCIPSPPSRRFNGHGERASAQ